MLNAIIRIIKYESLSIARSVQKIQSDQCFPLLPNLEKNTLLRIKRN